jgi:hypothetical protein
MSKKQGQFKESNIMSKKDFNKRLQSRWEKKQEEERQERLRRIREIEETINARPQVEYDCLIRPSAGLILIGKYSGGLL